MRSPASILSLCYIYFRHVLVLWWTISRFLHIACKNKYITNYTNDIIYYLLLDYLISIEILSRKSFNYKNVEKYSDFRFANKLVILLRHASRVCPLVRSIFST